MTNQQRGVLILKDKHATLLIGHSFHKSLEFDAVTLEAKSIIDGHLLARVERIKKLWRNKASGKMRISTTTAKSRQRRSNALG
uniref:Uncharacterized protein n=1 Tax=Vibrio phage Vc1 TaxID=1480731 RepID=A0A6M5CCS4_9CAUD